MGQQQCHGSCLGGWHSPALVAREMQVSQGDAPVHGTAREGLGCFTMSGTIRSVAEIGSDFRKRSFGPLYHREVGWGEDGLRGLGGMGGSGLRAEGSG